MEPTQDCEDAEADVIIPWPDLPPEIVNTIFALVLYKRDVGRLVCGAWDAAIRDGVTRLRLPASHLSAVQRYPAVTELHLTASIPQHDPGGVGVEVGSVDVSWLRVALPPPAAAPPAGTPAYAAEPAAAAAVITTDEAVAAYGAEPEEQTAATGLDLAEVWQQLPILPTLRELRLTGCSSAALPAPATAESMTRLTRVQIGPSFTIGIPTAVGSLPNLEALVLSEHWFQETEGDFAALKRVGHSLRELVIHNCLDGLREVPEWFGECLTGLTSLDLRDNALEGLPESFGQLQQLKVLDLSSNRFTTTGLGPLSALTSLEELALNDWLTTAGAAAAAGGGGGGGNPLFTELKYLTALERLSLAHNNFLMDVPASISALTALKVLSLRRCCSLSWIDMDILGCCSGLEKLDLSDSSLLEVPEDITRLTKLKELNLSRCPRLWTLPDSLLQLKFLKVLHVPTRVIAQRLLEQLELRGLCPVQVETDREFDLWSELGPLDIGSDAFADIVPEFESTLGIELNF